MQKLKALIIIILIIGTLVLVGRVGFAGLDFLPKGKLDTSDDSSDKNPVVQGVRIDNTTSTQLDKEMFLYLNGESGSKLVRYKLSSSRERLIYNFETQLEYLVPGNLAIIGDYLYWVEDLTVYKKDIYDNADPTEIYNSDEGFTLFGIVHEGADIYFSSYTEVDDEYMTNIYKYSGEEVELVQDRIEAIYPLVYSGHNQAEHLVTAYYNPTTNRIMNQTCLDVLDEVEVGCFQVVEDELFVSTRNPSASGFEMGKFGFINTVDNSGTTISILRGNIDENFYDVTLYGDDYFFLSGQIVPASLLLDEDGESYGSFEPTSLERIDSDGENRELLKVLPSAVGADIEYVDRDMIVLSISQKSSNKYEYKSPELWIYNRKSKDLEKLIEISCKDDEFCQVALVDVK